MKNLLSAPLEFLNDFHGGKSSKRFWGNRLLTIGVFLSLFLFGFVITIPVVSFLFMPVAKVMPPVAFEQAKDLITLFMAGGVGLLFGGLVEYFGNKKK